MQADPIRAPARAQDLTLRHRVKDYRAGDLERRYAALAIEEDFFINYGFVPRELQALMHPRAATLALDAGARGSGRRRCSSSCASAARCIRARSTRTSRTARSPTTGAARRTRPRTCSTACTTAACCAWRGARRGIRHLRGAASTRRRPTDAARAPRALDALVDVVVDMYAPLPAPSLAYVVSRLRYAAPQWQRRA